MDILVVYYTRTGNTRKIAEELAEELDAELEEIIDTTKRSGIIGWLRSGYHATREKLTEIKGIEKDPSNYDLIILGTPNWAGKLTPALRTYIKRYKDQFNNLAYFITLGGRKGNELIKSIGQFCEQNPVVSMQILQKEIKEDDYQGKFNEFIQKIKSTLH